MNNTLVKQIANPWTIEMYDAEVNNMLQRIEQVADFRKVVAISTYWQFEDEDKVKHFIGGARAYVGDSQEKIADELKKMDFDYAIDKFQHRHKDHAEIWGTVWLIDGSWIEIQEEIDEHFYEGGDTINYELKKAPTPPFR